MYCSSCGTESALGVQYCKRCGANLTPAGPSSTKKPQGIVWVVLFGIAMMIGLPMGGISVVFERIPDLLEKGLPLPFLLVLATTSLLMVSLATVLLSRLLSPVFKTYLQSGESAEQRQARLSAPPRLQIDAPYEACHLPCRHGAEEFPFDLAN